MLKRFAVLGIFIFALQACSTNTEYKTFLHDPILYSHTVVPQHSPLSVNLKTLADDLGSFPFVHGP